MADNYNEGKALDAVLRSSKMSWRLRRAMLAAWKVTARLGRARDLQQRVQDRWAFAGGQRRGLRGNLGPS